jgi:hypothetical protein
VGDSRALDATERQVVAEQLRPLLGGAASAAPSSKRAGPKTGPSLSSLIAPRPDVPLRTGGAAAQVEGRRPTPFAA